MFKPTMEEGRLQSLIKPTGTSAPKSSKQSPPVYSAFSVRTKQSRSQDEGHCCLLGRVFRSGAKSQPSALSQVEYCCVGSF